MAFIRRSLITLQKSAYAARPNTALNHNSCIFESRLKNLGMFVSENFVHTPNVLESFPTPKRYSSGNTKLPAAV